MMMWALSSILKCTIMPRSSSNSSHGLLWLLVISIVVAVQPVSIQSVSNLITNSGEQIMFFSKLIILHIKTKSQTTRPGIYTRVARKDLLMWEAYKA